MLRGVFSRVINTENHQQPLLARRGAIRFDQIEANSVVPAIEELIREAQAIIDSIGELKDGFTYENTLNALEQATAQLEDSMGWVDHLEGLLGDAALEAYNTIQPQVAAFYSAIPLNAGLWKALVGFSRPRRPTNSLPFSKTPEANLR